MIPKAAEFCSEIRNCDKYGTINVINLRPPLRETYADCWTPTVIWYPVVDLEKERPEAFGFIKIKFEYPLSGQTYDAWIIFPEAPLYSYDENQGIEVIAETLIPNMKRGATCAVYIDHVPSMLRPKDFGANFRFPKYTSNSAAVP